MRLVHCSASAPQQNSFYYITSTVRDWIFGGGGEGGGWNKNEISSSGMVSYLFTNDHLGCVNKETNQAIPKIQMIIKGF